MCSAQAGQRGRSVMLIEHTGRTGEKIRISGGGRCNFTNLHCSADKYISANPHFCKSALSRFSQYDFISMVDSYGIKWHEKSPEKETGQLFCDESAQQIISMLQSECGKGGVRIRLNTEIAAISRESGEFKLTCGGGQEYSCAKLVIATGGLSVPKTGAGNFAFRIARQFGIGVVETRPALVPLTFTDEVLELTRSLSGVSVEPVIASAGETSFKDALLFTHRGLSGPAILQISSYWNPGEAIIINLCPGHDIGAELKAAKFSQPRQMLHTVLSRFLPKRLADDIALRSGRDGRMADLPDAALREVAALIHKWEIRPNGNEGYRTAEVTRGGIDTDELSSKTFEAKKVPGLHFIGEAVDVTGHLGGHNFQWAWSSGWCCGQEL